MSRILVRGLGGPRLITRGYGSSATPPGPVRACLATGGLGIAQSLVTRGMRPISAVIPIDLLAAVAAKMRDVAALSPLEFVALDKSTADLDAYAVIVNGGSSHYHQTSTSEWKDVRLTIRLYAASSDDAESLGRALLAAAKAWGAIDYRDGFSLPLLETGRRQFEVRSKRPGDPGSACFEVTYSARCRKDV